MYYDCAFQSRDSESRSEPNPNIKGKRIFVPKIWKSVTLYDILWHFQMSQFYTYELCDISRFLSHGIYMYIYIYTYIYVYIYINLYVYIYIYIVCCSVLHRLALSCSVCCNVCCSVCCSVCFSDLRWQCVAVCWSVLMWVVLCVAVYCSVL